MSELHEHVKGQGLHYCSQALHPVATAPCNIVLTWDLVSEDQGHWPCFELSSFKGKCQLGVGEVVEHKKGKHLSFFNCNLCGARHWRYTDEQIHDSSAPRAKCQQKHRHY